MYTRDTRMERYAKRRQQRIRKLAKPRWSLKRRIAVTLASLLIVMISAGAVYAASKFNKIEIKKLNANDLNITNEVEHETGFLNVALFGLDTREDGSVDGSRSDTIMVASLNKETGEIKLCSVYRDTLLDIRDGEYNKANAAYSFGGAQSAVSMLNKNLDLDVDHYVSVDFRAMVDVINAVGGIDIDVTEEEVEYVNGYANEIIHCTGIDSPGIDSAGLQTLDGVSATAYARIRYTAGDDYKRTERQRDVLSKVAEKLKKCSISTLNKIIDKVFPEVQTNFTLAEMIKYAKNAKNYTVGETTGFPYEKTTNTLSGIGSTVIATDFANDVVKLHQFLYGDTGYAVSSVVQTVASTILSKNVTSTDTTGVDEQYYYGENYNSDYSNNNNYNYNNNASYNSNDDNSYDGYDDSGGSNGNNNSESAGDGYDTGGDLSGDGATE